MRKKIEKSFWDMEIIGNRRKKLLLTKKIVLGMEFHHRKDQKRFEVSSPRKFHDDGGSCSLFVIFKRF